MVVQRVAEGNVHVAVDACAWGVGYVVGGCNVQFTCCTEHGRYGLSCLYSLSCLYAETVKSMSSAGFVECVYVGV